MGKFWTKKNGKIGTRQGFKADLPRTEKWGGGEEVLEKLPLIAYEASQKNFFVRG